MFPKKTIRTEQMKIKKKKKRWTHQLGRRVAASKSVSSVVSTLVRDRGIEKLGHVVLRFYGFFGQTGALGLKTKRLNISR